MTTLALDTVYKIENRGSMASGSMSIEVADVDVYESWDEAKPLNAGQMIHTETLASGTGYAYNSPARWILFQSAGAAVVKENGLVTL